MINTKGKQSTEFWLIVAFMVGMLANGTDYFNVPWETLQWLGGMVAVYTGGRSFVKGTAFKAAAPEPLNTTETKP